MVGAPHATGFSNICGCVSVRDALATQTARNMAILAGQAVTFDEVDGIPVVLLLHDSSLVVQGVLADPGEARDGSPRERFEAHRQSPPRPAVRTPPHAFVKNGNDDIFCALIQNRQ